MEIPLNVLAMGVTVVALVALGSIWFGPLFGKAYMKEVGVSPEDVEKFKQDPAAKNKMMKSYLLMALGSIVMVFVMAHEVVFLSSYLHLGGAVAGVKTGFLNWLGFTAPVLMGAVLWENKSWKWWGITAGYYLVAYCIAGTILALWV